jgi:hypothetical protein
MSYRKLFIAQFKEILLVLQKKREAGIDKGKPI